MVLILQPTCYTKIHYYQTNQSINRSLLPSFRRGSGYNDVIEIFTCVLNCELFIKSFIFLQ